MGWQTDLFCNVSFNRKTYNSLYEVESDLEEIQKCIATCEEELRDMAIMTEPEKMYNKEDYCSPYDFVHQTVHNNLELLREYYVDEYKLYLLKDNWDACHDGVGLAIPPKDLEYDAAFLDGDFIKTIDNPNGKD